MALNNDIGFVDSLGQCDFVKFVILSRRIGILYRGPSSLYTCIIELGKTPSQCW